MDLLSHAFYGATVCSRSGLAGGLRRRPPGSRWYTDASVGWGVAFGLLPDVVSMGPPFLLHLLTDAPGHFFGGLGEEAMQRYAIMHSLVIALPAVLLLRRVRPALFLPALAWPLHVIMDAFTHGAGRFQTPVLYPLSGWGIDGVRWWMHPELVQAYWALLPLTWLALWLLRRRAAS